MSRHAMGSFDVGGFPEWFSEFCYDAIIAKPPTAENGRWRIPRAEKMNLVY